MNSNLSRLLPIIVAVSLLRALSNTDLEPPKTALPYILSRLNAVTSPIPLAEPNPRCRVADSVAKRSQYSLPEPLPRVISTERTAGGSLHWRLNQQAMVNANVHVTADRYRVTEYQNESNHCKLPNIETK